MILNSTRELKDTSLRKRHALRDIAYNTSYNFHSDEQAFEQQWTLLNYTRIMSYVADRHRIWLARSCPTATTILSVRYRIPVIAHVDKASATNRGPLGRLSSSASSSPVNERLTIVARASSSNTVGAFRTRRVLAERLHADLCLGLSGPGRWLLEPVELCSL